MLARAPFPIRAIQVDGGSEFQALFEQACHQRCWVRKMRNLLEKVRKRDYDRVKADAQAICLAENLAKARNAFQGSGLASKPFIPPSFVKCRRTCPSC